MKVNRFSGRNSAGFTILEAVMIIAIIGILAVVITPARLQTQTTLQYEARRILNDIHYVQALSMSTGFRYRWVRTSANTYQLLNEAGTAIVLPTGGTTVSLSSGITFGTLTNLPNNLVAFNSFGTPYTTSTIPGTVLAASATIPVTNGSQTTTITITPTTGSGAVS